MNYYLYIPDKIETKTYHIGFTNDMGHLLIESIEKIPWHVEKYIYDTIVKDNIEPYFVKVPNSPYSYRFYKTKDPNLKDKIIKYNININREDIILIVSYEKITYQRSIEEIFNMKKTLN